MKKFRYIRVIFAILFFIPILISFIDFTGILPDSLNLLLHIQWIPALISFNIIIIASLLLLSLLLGRIYCSTICPLGVLQDILIRINRFFGTKKQKYHYRKPNNLLRYGVLIITVFLFLIGFSLPVLLLDPYSNFGRIASTIFRPVVLFLNNQFAAISNAHDSYVLYNVPITTITIASFTFACFFLLMLLVLTRKWGRLYCNIICPVGTGLGLLSKLTLYKVKINKETCIGCGLCAKQCKAECIDAKNKNIDETRCVNCYNCLDSCKSGAIQYIPSTSLVKKNLRSENTIPANASRRALLKMSGLTLLSTTVAKADVFKSGRDRDSILYRKPIMPPGAKDRTSFLRKCTACQLCITKCPSHILQPASFNEYGVEGFLQPHITYKHGFCNYNCTVCLDVCPTQALESMSVDKKRLTQIGIAQFRSDLCIVITEETSCGACSEHCPTQAVSMIPHKNGITIPHLNADICIGCGGCEYICPVEPHKAIYIEGLSIPKEALSPYKEETNQEAPIEDFGF